MVTRAFDSKNLDSLVVAIPLPPASEQDRELAEQNRPQSGVSLIILDRKFDPNGPTEIYLDFNLKNPGPRRQLRTGLFLFMTKAR